jgi:hypothetical protein
VKARKKNNRLWSGEFKLKVVLDIIENELSYSQAARNLSVMGETRKLHPHPVFGRLVGAVDQLISDNESYYLTKSITSGFQSRGVHLCTIAPSGVCIITRFWCKQAVFSPFRLSDLTINTRKPLKSKDSSIVSILEFFCGAFNRNRTRPHPYHGCFLRSDNLRQASSSVRTCGAHVPSHAARLGRPAPGRARFCARKPRTLTRPGAHPWQGRK